MALAVDASTPAYVTNANDPWTTASFTPPVGSLLVVVVSADWFNGTPTIAVTSSGLTFTSRIKVGANNAGVVEIFTAEVGAAGGTPRTVAGTTTLTDDSGGMKVYVVTGQHITGYVDTTGSGSSATNAITPTVLTSGFDGCWVFGGAEDWNNLGLATSTDVFENGAPGGIAPICARKSAATSPAGAVTLNFDASGAGAAVWRWAAISIRPAAGGAVSGTIAGNLPAFTGSLTGSGKVSGTAAASLSAMTGSINGTARASATLAGNLPSLTASLTGAVEVGASLDGSLPAFTGDLTGSLDVTGSLAADLPALTGALTGDVSTPGTPVTGTLSGSLPAMQGAVSGGFTVSGTIPGLMPAMAAAVTGAVRVAATLAGNLPSLVASLTGTAGPVTPFTPALTTTASVRAYSATATTRDGATATVRDSTTTATVRSPA